MNNTFPNGIFGEEKERTVNKLKCQSLEKEKKASINENEESGFMSLSTGMLKLNEIALGKMLVKM